MKLNNRSIADYGQAYIPVFDPPVIIDKQLPLSFCSHLVQELNRSSATASGVHDSSSNTAKVDNYHRSSSAVMIEPTLYAEAAKLITTVVNLHSGWLLAKRAELCEPLQFLKYDASNAGHFLAHTDNAYYDGAGKFQYTAPKRHLTCVAYINDDYEGGDFIMHTVKNDDGSALKLHPAIGELVIFPSDIRFLHEVTNVTKGCRYSIVSWFSLK